MYFLDPDNSADEWLTRLLNYISSHKLIELSEHIIRALNGYAQGYMMMREVTAEINRELSVRHLLIMFVLSSHSVSRILKWRYIGNVCQRCFLTLSLCKSSKCLCKSWKSFLRESMLTKYEKEKNICVNIYFEFTYNL